MANFRSTYYATLGFKNVSIDREFEILLRESDVDIDRLRRLCALYGVANVYRPIVHKLLIGYLPSHQAAWAYTTVQRIEEWRMLHAAALLIAPQHPQRQLTSALLLDCYLLSLGFYGFVDPPAKRLNDSPDFPAIQLLCDAISALYQTPPHSDTDDSDDDEGYPAPDFSAALHLLKYALSSVDSSLSCPTTFKPAHPRNWSLELKMLADLLQREEKELFEHLRDLEVSIKSFAERWFDTLFCCTVLEHTAHTPTTPLSINHRQRNMLQRLLDRSMTRDPRTNACVAVAVLRVSRHTLLATHTAQAVQTLLSAPLSRIPSLTESDDDLLFEAVSELYAEAKL